MDETLPVLEYSKVGHQRDEDSVNAFGNHFCCEDEEFDTGCVAVESISHTTALRELPDTPREKPRQTPHPPLSQLRTLPSTIEARIRERLGDGEEIFVWHCSPPNALFIMTLDLESDAADYKRGTAFEFLYDGNKWEFRRSGVCVI